jgi:predicted DNA-binding antitoxin AbrB/MazE fold protein
MALRTEETTAMSIQMEAVYENGVFRPLQPVSLAEHQRVTFTIDDADNSAAVVDAAHFTLTPDQWQAFCDALGAPPRNVPALQKLLTGLSLFDEKASNGQ